MEIPNYDNDSDNEKKFKQIHPFMPKDTFRLLICRNSGSGKTNLLYHMLMAPLIYYDEIYLYAKNYDQKIVLSLTNNLSNVYLKLDGSSEIKGKLDMDNNKIVNLKYNHQNESDAVNKHYVDSAINKNNVKSSHQEDQFGYLMSDSLEWTDLV